MGPTARRYNLTLPSDLEEGTYNVSLECRINDEGLPYHRLNASSIDFTILPPRADDGLEITLLPWRQSWYVGSTYDITWNAWGRTRDQQINIELLNRGIVSHTIATEYASRGRYVWTIPGLCDGGRPVTGEGLKLRIRTLDGRYGTESEFPLDIRMPAFSLCGTAK